jgi:hypothetical protein
MMSIISEKRARTGYVKKSLDNRVRDKLQYILTPTQEAVALIKERRKDNSLVSRVDEFLGHDVPVHFKQTQPILYLSRHVATPNYETLYFCDTARQHGLPVIIGQDRHDRFVPNNVLKRNLGKMPIVKGFSQNNEEIIEKITVVDFMRCVGKRIIDVKTKSNVPLTDFHNRLLENVCGDAVQLVDESSWVSRNHRGDLVKHYTKLLSLMVCYGVMFEYYETEDDLFVDNVLIPSFREVTAIFGVKPLITDLIDPDIEAELDWNAYPSVVYQQVKYSMNTDIFVCG